MAETSTVANEKAVSSNSCIPHEEEKVSTPGPVEIGSPLTPVDHLPLSTPKEPTSRRYLFHQDADGDDSNEVLEGLGYDSDGNAPPVSTIGDSFHVEPEAGLKTRSDAEKKSDDCQVVIIDMDDIKKMKVDQLRKELRLRGLSHRGLKAELIERLNKACEDKVPLINEVTTSVGPSGFDERAQWRLLKAHEQAEEPESLDPALVEPGRARDQRTRQGIADDGRGMKKYNYSEKFDREEFSAMALQLVVNETKPKVTPKKGASKKKRKKTSTTKLASRKYEKQPIKTLIPNIKFVEKHHLNEFSSPADWFRAFIPESPKKGESNSLCIQKWCQFTNMKAQLDFAGNAEFGGLSYKFVPFTPREIEQHLAMYMIQGLNPSPQLKLKSKSQSVESIQGNDLVFRCIGGDNYEKRHKQFKRYFAVQHPYLPIPDTNTHPNWKLDPFLKHLNQIFMQAVHLPERISCEGQTIGFHGSSKHKSRIKYKKTGDGFQADSICCKGYTYTFYFRHQQAPKKYVDEGYSPLHARVRFMFDHLKSTNHSCFMDNLYMSASFARNVFSCEKKVRIHGVTRREGKGIPSIIKQLEVQDINEVERVRNTIKVAVLEGDTKVNDLVAISYYDSKPCYFLSTVIDEVSWVTCGKQIYSKLMKKR